MNRSELPQNLLAAMAIIQNSGNEDGWMSEHEHRRPEAELGNLELKVVIAVNEEDHRGDDAPGTDEEGRTFFEVSLTPLVKQIADESGAPFTGNAFCPLDGISSENAREPFDGYPDAMYQKWWSVTSWALDGDCDYDDDDDAEENLIPVDEEDFPDFESAIACAEALASRYRVVINKGPGS